MKYIYPGACADIGHCAVHLHTNTLPLELEPLCLDQFQTETGKTWNHSERRGTLVRSPMNFFAESRRPPPRIIFKLFEGVFLIPSLKVIKKQHYPLNYFDHSQLSVITIIDGVVFKLFEGAIDPFPLGTPE